MAANLPRDREHAPRPAARSAELRRRRDGDATRARRNFELHVRLAGPLREWYQAVERVAPGRVRWGLPDGGLPPDTLLGRPDRCDPALFDAVVGALPALDHTARE
jgi:hypothetical protein